MADEHGNRRAPGSKDAPGTGPGGADRRATEPNGRRTGRWIIAGVLAVLVVAGLALTQPWKLFVDVTVDEAKPATASTTSRAPTASSPTSTDPSIVPSTTVAPVPVGGTFVSHAHGTTGTVQVLTTEGGGTVVRLEDLATDNGPDLKVYLSTNPADSGQIGAGALSLGDLKGNRGNQNYEVPRGSDLSSFRSVVIWCERFTVAFGAAPLI